MSYKHVKMIPNQIKAIDKTSVHRICSGQVVLSLAIAVKELLENSLDAGATVVEIRLKDYGNELVEVIDNGSGVHPENFQALTLKHHTSKLSDFSDLESVATFGFRGEALSSLCALSKVTVCTRHSSQEVGSFLQFDHNGTIVSQISLSRQVGTTVSLSNIFSTLPVRQKEFQRNLKKEFNKMVQLVYAYCLVSTDVRITCINQTNKGTKTTLVSTQGCLSVKENVSCVFGPKQLSGLLEVKKSKLSEKTMEELKILEDVLDMFKLEGYVSSCAHGAGRASADRQFYYINSRPCEPVKIMKAVNEVYHQYNIHQYPFVFLNVFVSRDSVDVNVTPDKRQIFLDQEKLLLAIIKASLVDLYEKIPSTYSVNTVKVTSQMTSPSSMSSGASLNKFSQWRHKSDSVKREPTSQLSPDKKPKQRKLDCDFSFSLKKRYEENLDVKSEQNLSEEGTCETQVEIESSGDKGTGSGVNCDMSFENSNEDVDKELIFDENKFENAEEKENHFEQTEKCDVKIHSGEIEIQSELKLESKSETSEEFLKGMIGNSNLENTSTITQPCSGNNVSTGDSQRSENNDEDIHRSENNCVTEYIPCSEINNDTEGTSFNSIITEKEITSVKNGAKIIFTDHDSTLETRKTVYHDLNLDSLRLICQNRDQESISELPKVKFRTTIDPSNNTKAEEELNKEISKDMFSKMEIIGQFNLGFIITKLGSDLFIIDQHATDEKYNFETLQQTTVLSSQNLVVPQNLDLTPANECLLLENLDIFKKNGFDFTIDENASSNRAKLSAIPMSRNWIFGKEDVDELLFMLQDSPGTLCRPSRVRSMFASRACRKSVMIGSHLSRKDMRKLVDHMGEIEQPWNCPHGRPTMRHLVNLGLIS